MSKKIKVLQCVSAMNRGGLEAVIMNYYRNIDHDKFSFDFLVQRRGSFDYSNEIKELGGKIYSVPAFNPLKIKKYNTEINNFFKNHSGEYDIVHAHNNSFAMYVLRSAKKHNFNVRISHSHTADVKLSLIKYPFIKYNKIKLQNVCNARFACSEKAGKWLFNDNQFTIIKNAIDLKKFSFDNKKRKEYREKYKILPDTILIGHIGRFEKPKNHIFLVNLIKDLKDKKLNAKLMLIGTGKLEPKIKAFVKKYNLEKEVIFTGNIDNPHDLLNAMDVFVFPSHYEGLGMAVIEAQANGLHCIISDTIKGECEITPLVEHMSLTDNTIQEWTKQIISTAKLPRKEYSDLLTIAGYNIKEATKKLEQIYQTLIQANKSKTEQKLQK